MRSTSSPNFALSQARIEVEVVAALLDYLARLTPEEMALVPIDCKKQGLAGAAQVGEWAVALTRADLSFTGSREEADALHDISIAFVEGSSRIAQMAQEARLMTPRANGDRPGDTAGPPA